jgi:hypothetical protein
MASNTRIRVEPDIEDYLKKQAERVIGKSGDGVSGAELTTIANRLLYEHKIAHSMTKQIPFARIFNWLMGLMPGTANGGKIVALSAPEQPALKPSQKDEDFDFAADFADQFEEDAA